MKALCGFEFNKKELTKTQLDHIDFKLKLPILNNMALAFMQLGQTSPPKLIIAKNLIDQVLKIEPKNEKAIMRKCNILLDLDKVKECEELMKNLEDVAFQSERSQIIYNEITHLKERIANPGMNRREQQRKQFVKENDWYYNHKKNTEREKQLEEEFKKSLNPIFALIYTHIYLRCCKKRRQYNFSKPKQN